MPLLRMPHTSRSPIEYSISPSEDMAVSASDFRSRRTSGPRLDPRFYDDTNMIDVTIIFGPNGEHRFDGHRLVLYNSIEWFNRSAANFKEASSREITLHGDDPEAIRAMLKWAYFGQYSESVKHSTSLKEAKDLFLQHLRVFVVADKYVAEGLEKLVFDRLSELISYYLSKPIEGRPETAASSFMRFVIEEVFVHQTCFDLLGNMTNVSSSDTAYNSDDAMIDEVMFSMEEDEDFCKMEDEDEDFQHPMDRIQAFIVKECIFVWREIYKTPEFTKEHLRALVAKVDGFGAAMALETLKHVPNNTRVHPMVIRPRFRRLPLMRM